jgi:hypothetical protein
MAIPHAILYVLRRVMMQHASIRLPIREWLPRTRLIRSMDPASISFTLAKQRSTSIRIIRRINIVKRQRAQQDQTKEDWKKSRRKGHGP